MSEKSQLVDRLIASQQSRTAYTRSKISVNVASQIRAMRRRRELTQQGLAQEVEMKQSRISALERPGTKFNIETLVRLAAAFKVGLVVKFVPFSEMVRWENGFSQDVFDVVAIEHDSEFLKPEPVLFPVAANIPTPSVVAWKYPENMEEQSYRSIDLEQEVTSNPAVPLNNSLAASAGANL
ncbi:MAG: helix-turn-helix transcriptional regulator [Candidatus Acidiferrum sp.]